VEVTGGGAAVDARWAARDAATAAAAGGRSGGAASNDKLVLLLRRRVLLVVVVRRQRRHLRHARARLQVRGLVMLLLLPVRARAARCCCRRLI
jgi:hypothetical protein